MSKAELADVPAPPEAISAGGLDRCVAELTALSLYLAAAERMLRREPLDRDRLAAALAAARRELERAVCGAPRETPD